MCFSNRGIFIESKNLISTEAIIEGLWRFAPRQWNGQVSNSHNSTHSDSTNVELNKECSEMNLKKVDVFCWDVLVNESIGRGTLQLLAKLEEYKSDKKILSIKLGSTT